MVAAGVKPIEPYPGRNKPWRSRCLTCDRIVTPRLDSVLRGRGGCKYCGGKEVHPADAESVMRDAGLSPLEAFPGSHHHWPCECLECGRTVAPSYHTVAMGHGGCVYCAGKKVDSNEAEAVMRAAGLMPQEPYPGGKTPWKSACITCGRKVAPIYNQIQQGAGGCAWCAGVRIDPKDAVEVMRGAWLEPLEPYPSALKPWRCKCQRCGQEVAPRYASINAGQGGCVWCAGNRITPEAAEFAMRNAGLEPLEEYPGSHYPWLCRCMNCGREVRPRHHGIAGGQGGCIYCAARGSFDPEKPARLYLLTHSDWRAAKIGITNIGATPNRITVHTVRGWIIAKTWRFPSGGDAYHAEQLVIRSWREEGFPEVIPPEDMPQGGYSETVSLEAVSLESIERKVRFALARAGVLKTDDGD